VHEVFTTMAAEEEKHIETLSRLFTNIVKTERPAFSIPKINPARIADADAVLTEQIKHEVEAASHEAAAIYAAMGMEEKAVSFYSEQAKNAAGKEKELFTWLADWERTHLDFLMALNKDLRQRVWQDQRFWPCYGS